MAQEDEQKLVEFLISERNVCCVLEVLKHGDAIRRALLNRFWSRVRTHLGATAPKGLATKVNWSASPLPQETKSGFAWLEARFPRFEDERQCLCYRVEYERWPQGLDLYYGLHWRQETRRSTRSRSIKPVQSLRQALDANDYKLSDQESWCGWRYVRRFNDTDDFLSFFVENPKFLLESISEGLWPFVHRTIKHVERVNRSLSA
ncbi:MAG TPA: hypothetical protein PKM73_07510 [Verrucomicrobiota bacterium]|nr:hypothetical protein [Verrucomicrobiota bacterium]HNU51265.1 hypothetical protein [Verrucomicrobiota bacterium]